MDSDAKERVINRITSAAIIGMLLIFAYFVRESLPFVTFAAGGVLGQFGGAELARRVERQTRRKVALESERPPGDDDHPSGGTTLMSEPPAPRMPRRDGSRNFFAIFATLALMASACATTPNPVAGVYGAERARCVEKNDAAADARACMRDVDARYGQDGGLR